MILDNLFLYRENYTLKSTTGILESQDSKFKCYTLEDVVRGENIKIPGRTAIPDGIYKVILTMSHRFKRLMPMIFTESNGYELRNKGVSFKGVRFHGGNTHKNTEGCPLIAHNKLSNDLIQGTAEKDLVEYLKSKGLKEQKLPLSGDYNYVQLYIINHGRI